MAGTIEANFKEPVTIFFGSGTFRTGLARLYSNPIRPPRPKPSAARSEQDGWYGERRANIQLARGLPLADSILNAADGRFKVPF